jgi:hypothetical protein
MGKIRCLIGSFLVAVALVAVLGVAPAAAGPRACVYDSVGNELCVSENGAEIPSETMWFCVIYTFSGGQICVSSDGQISENP